MESFFMGGVSLRFASMSERVVAWSPDHATTRSDMEAKRGGYGSFLLFIRPNLRRLRVGVRPEVTQRHERLLSGVLEHDAGPCRIVAHEHLVLGQLAEADHRWRLQRHLTHPARALNGDETVGAIVLHRHLDARID